MQTVVVELLLQRGELFFGWEGDKHALSIISYLASHNPIYRAETGISGLQTHEPGPLTLQFMTIKNPFPVILYVTNPLWSSHLDFPKLLNHFSPYRCDMLIVHLYQSPEKSDSPQSSTYVVSPDIGKRFIYHQCDWVSLY